MRPLEHPLHPLENEAARAAAPMAAIPEAAEPPVDRAAAILAARCASCHGAQAPAGGVRADTPAALLGVQHGVRWVTPGHLDESRLFEVVGSTSPTPRHRLTEAEVEILRAWISSAGR